VLGVVEDARVDLVREDGYVVLGRHLRDRAQPALRDDASGRIVRIVQDDEARLGTHAVAELTHVEGERLLLQQPHRHRDAADVPDHRLVDREAGIGIEDLVAFVHEGEDHEEHDRLGAGRDHHHLGRRAHAAPPRRVLCDRLPQLGQAGGRTVVRGPAAKGGDGGFGDMAGRVEVGLADLEMHHVAALRLQGPRAHEDLESRLRTQPRHPLREPHVGNCIANGGARQPTRSAAPAQRAAQRWGVSGGAAANHRAGGRSASARRG
jgi:hypothetical protein